MRENKKNLLKRIIVSLLFVVFGATLLVGCGSAEEREQTWDIYDQVSGRVAMENLMDNEYSTVTIYGKGESFEQVFLHALDKGKHVAPYIIIFGIVFMVIFIPVFNSYPQAKKKVIFIGCLLIILPLILIYGAAALITFLTSK